MKKTKIIKAILAPIGKGVFIFAVFGFALYVYAAVVDFPDTAPTPVTGVVGQFVGLSASNYDSGSDYNGVNAECSTTHTGSHICTAMEIINTYNNDPTAFSGLAGADIRGWINNGPPGYLATPANDCNGWQTTSSSKYGSIWIFKLDVSPSSAKQALLQTCNNLYPFACCK